MKRLALIVLPLIIVVSGCASATPAAQPSSAGRAVVATRSASTSSAVPSKPVPVPNVKGKIATLAKWRLELTGFKVKIHRVRDTARRSMVIAQRPAGGKAKPGSTIVLTVSNGPTRGSAGEADAASPAAAAGQDAAARAFQRRASGVQLSGAGIVSKVLPDDAVGDRHQRFILQLPSGQTLLIAHNIDIASRLPSLAPGETVEFKGIYEWSAQGGTVHWTHHDPSGGHPAGWLRYNGQMYR